MDKSFDKQYVIELTKLKVGTHEVEFDIDRSFFELFEYSQVESGEIKVMGTIQKYETHLDTAFTLDGTLTLACDRCTEPYPHKIHSENRVIFAYDKRLEFDNDDIVLLDPSEHELDLSQEFYDFIHLEIPIRKVPDPEVHTCAPEILALLEGKPEGEAEAEEDATVDPRWAKLNELKNKLKE